MVSSTKPVCFFKMGMTFSWMVLASSLALPDLASISITRANSGASRLVTCSELDLIPVL